MRLAGQEVREYPGLPGREILKRCANLILEEAIETVRGMGFYVDGDFNDYWLRDHPEGSSLTEAVDGCADLRVVATCALSAMGVDDESIQKLVDDNNLQKFGPGGHRREDGKWVKPPGHKPPDIAGELDRQRMVEAHEDIGDGPLTHADPAAITASHSGKDGHYCPGMDGLWICEDCEEYNWCECV